MKQIADFKLVEKQDFGRSVMLRLHAQQPLPEILPGQFVQVRVDGSPTTYLRRPISIHDVDSKQNEITLLVQQVGEGTRHMAAAEIGDTLNVVLPLGNGFSLPENGSEAPKMLLVGGGVGVAPLLFYGSVLHRRGLQPTFLLGARTEDDLTQLDEFRKYGRVLLTTEDGTAGERGFVTNHSVLEKDRFDHIATCGPKPMMQAVARYARENGIACEASLENLMACGLGACLCCVEKTTEGNLCVCKEGPVFDVKRLLW